MFELEDVGKEVHVRVRRLYTDCDVNKSITMVIKAPRGTLTLFEQNPRQYSKYLGQTHGDAQCKAIRAFMEEHKSD